MNKESTKCTCVFNSKGEYVSCFRCTECMKIAMGFPSLDETEKDIEGQQEEINNADL